MSAAPAEFSRPVPLACLGSAPFRQQIEATADERERLARRLDLIALERLTAMVTLCRREGDAVLLEAAFEAAFTQTCVITLEPVAGAVAESFTLLYGPIDDDRPDLELDVEDTVYEPLSGDSIDIGEAVAQELSLSLPEFPRDPDAVIDTAASEAPDARFAALSRLRDRDPD